MMRTRVVTILIILTLSLISCGDHKEIKVKNDSAEPQTQNCTHTPNLIDHTASPSPNITVTGKVVPYLFCHKAISNSSTISTDEFNTAMKICQKQVWDILKLPPQ